VIPDGDLSDRCWQILLRSPLPPSLCIIGDDSATNPMLRAGLQHGWAVPLHPPSVAFFAASAIAPLSFLCRLCGCSSLCERANGCAWPRGPPAAPPEPAPERASDAAVTQSAYSSRVATFAALGIGWSGAQQPRSDAPPSPRSAVVRWAVLLACVAASVLPAAVANRQSPTTDSRSSEEFDGSIVVSLADFCGEGRSLSGDAFVDPAIGLSAVSRGQKMHHNFSPVNIIPFGEFV
jgi:hypothetical protein